MVNHLTGEPMAESRNVLIEAARIVRGDIHPLVQADAAELDALIVPGGFGAAKNLSTFATQGAACHVDPDLKALSLAMHAAGKPQGFICIAPAMLPKILISRCGSRSEPTLILLKLSKIWAANTCHVR